MGRRQVTSLWEGANRSVQASAMHQRARYTLIPLMHGMPFPQAGLGPF